MTALTQALPQWRPTWLIGRTVFIELRRRKDVAVLLMLMGLYVVGVVAFGIVGIERPSTATLLLNLGLTMAWAAAHITTLVLAARQLPDELEQRTIYPLLARPVARGWVVLGKWGAATLAGWLVLGVLALMGWLPVPKMEAYSAPLLAQMLALHGASLAVLAAWALAGSLLLPRAVNCLGLGLLVAFGGKLGGFVNLHFAETPLAGPVRWLTAYLPDFGKLDLVTRYTDGVAALDAATFAGLLAYAAILTGVALALAGRLFQRRSL